MRRLRAAAPAGGDPDAGGGSTTSTEWKPPAGRTDPLGGEPRQPETAEEFQAQVGFQSNPSFHRDDDVSVEDPREEQQR